MLLPHPPIKMNANHLREAIDMADDKKLRVNYYVGALLAQGGEVRVDDSKIVFSPTSAIDRAMGAKDVEIPFQNIQGLEQKSDISRTFHIKTGERVHKFEGSQARELAKLLEQTLQSKGHKIKFEKKETELTGSGSLPLSTTGVCPTCAKYIKNDFAFCPYCERSLKPLCKSCHRTLEPDWKLCAYCGTKI